MMVDIYEIDRLGSRVRELRESAGLTQYKLSKDSGVSQALLCRVESGASVPSLGALRSIGLCLGIGIAEFFPRRRRDD